MSEATRIQGAEIAKQIWEGSRRFHTFNSVHAYQMNAYAPDTGNACINIVGPSEIYKAWQTIYRLVYSIQLKDTVVKLARLIWAENETWTDETLASFWVPFEWFVMNNAKEYVVNVQPTNE